MLVPDLPGYGRSEKPKHVQSVIELAHALREWLDTVGIERALFIGNSMGCQIITELAHIDPHRICACGFLGPTMDQFAPSRASHVFRLLLDQFREPPSLVPLQAFDYLGNGPFRMIETFLKAVEHDMLLRVKCIDQPCLVMRGERDPIASQQWIEALASKMRNAEWRTIPNAGHALNYNSPRSVICELVSFWRRHGIVL